MATDHPRGLSPTATPPKVVGLGAPISVWIYFELSEIPALIDAIGDELARYGACPQSDRHPVRPQATAASECSDRIGELRRMYADLQRAATRMTRRFDVVWPTVLAHGVVHARCVTRSGVPTASRPDVTRRP